jgi:PAS domain S-box-containing protein
MGKIRKRSELEKTISQDQLYNVLLNGITDAVSILDPKTYKIIDANKAFCKLLQRSREGVIGKTCYEVTHGRDIPCEPPDHSCPLEELLESGKSTIREHVHFDSGGQKRYVEVTVYPVRKKKKIYQVIHISRDITERKRAEEEIRRLKEFNEEIVEKMEEGVAILDEDARVTFVNPKALSMFGIGKEELEGESFLALCRGNEREVIGYLREVKEEGRPVQFENVFYPPDGKEVTVLGSCTPLRNNEDFGGYLLTLTDITDWKAEEDAYIETNLKYAVTRGNAYLSEEPEMERAMDAFKNLLQGGYKGVVITRRHPEEVREKYSLNEETPVYWLGSEAAPSASTLPPNFPILEKEIRDFIGRRRVVLLDRLDYLISQNGFEGTLSFVQRLHELVFARGGVVLLTLISEAFPPHHLALLRAETRPLERKEKPPLSEDLLEILEFIHRENREGRKPYHKDISGHFHISRTTELKRLSHLKALGLVADEAKGRLRALSVTEKGRDLLKGIL